jgi:hypothetical protein
VEILFDLNVDPLVHLLIIILLDLAMVLLVDMFVDLLVVKLMRFGSVGLIMWVKLG